MQGVNKFLDGNPTETIVFIYQVNNDVDQEVNLNSFYDQLLLVDGLTEKLYTALYLSITLSWNMYQEFKIPHD